MTEELLKVVDINKTFAGVWALRGVSLTINRGEILCLVGENGSGKSTLIKIICGVYQQDSGEIYINGKQYKNLQPIDAIREGIQVIFQDFSLFPNLTVAENIALNHELARGKSFVNWRDINEIARQALDRIGVDLPLNATVDEMSVANKQLIAISRAMLLNARLVIMDEPTTALTQKEVEALFRVVKSLQEAGVSILFVSHKLNEVQAIAERVIIVRNGSKVLDTAAGELTQHKIAYYMTGHEVTSSTYDYQPQANGQESLLSVHNLTRTGSFEDISFDLKAGEILGVTGLLGSGRTELALALFGIKPADSGDIIIKGQPVRIRNIQDAIRHNIGYVPEDRLTEGLFLLQSITNNIVVRTLKDILNQFGLFSSSDKSKQARRWVDSLHIKTSDPQLPVSSLSGGNQQRVVIAKWLASMPHILILNGPTVGVDIGSKSEIHEVIRELARNGMGIIVISDDIPELTQVCNRILLLRRGRLYEEFVVSEIDEVTLNNKLLEIVI